MSDRYDLRRFVAAQQDVYDAAVSELRAGRKTSHLDVVHPSADRRLGRSAIAQKYAIASLAEAESHMAHPLLGPRLFDCARILTRLSGRSARELSGAVDAQKLQSSMTPVRTRRGGTFAARRGAGPVLRRRRGSSDTAAALNARRFA
jgi:uncharacterized protein (DUF1810 family)